MNSLQGPAAADRLACRDLSDPQRIGQIYEQHAAALYRYIYFRVQDTQLAEDLLADVFVRMLEGIHRYEDRGWPISAWLYRIARDRIIDTMRRQVRQCHIPLEHWHGIDDGPASQTDMHDDHAALRRFFFCLTHLQRTVLWLRFVDERSLQEVARDLGLTVSAVKSVQYRGLKTLARLLGNERE